MLSPAHHLPFCSTQSVIMSKLNTSVFRAIIICSLLASGTVAQQPQRPLDNERIVALAHAGVHTDELLILIASAAEVSFALSPVDTDTLFRAGVSKAVISAMAGKQSGKSSSPFPPPPNVEIPAIDPLANWNRPTPSSSLRTAQQSGTPQWQYKTVHSDEELNESAGNGWELVTMTSDQQGTNYVLKRRKGVVDPVLLYKIEPRYTRRAFKRNIQGNVLLSLTVTNSGIPSDIRVMKSLDPGLDASAIAAVKEWRFKPGTVDAQPTPMRANVTTNFELNRGQTPEFWFIFVYH